MGNCCSSGTIPPRRLRRQESRAQRESRKIRVVQHSSVRELLKTDEAEGHSAFVGPDLSLEETARQSVRLDEVTLRADKVDIAQYSFPFENLVFEGGGVKGLAYCGTVRVLENHGLWPQIKRLAGSSSGAMTAALLAVGYNSDDIQKFLSQDLSNIFLDHSCGLCSLLPNLIRDYGWNPGKRIYRWFGHVLFEQTGNADITFSEVYDYYGKELCIIATNLNMMNAEYFHLKTTPDMPVREAVRMSMGIPGLYQARKYEMNGQINTYIDGGVLCNYPIHCYDGWWLSMAREDSFITKLDNLEDFSTLYEKKERFGKYNDKTIGFLLYSDDERDVLQNKLEERVGPLPTYPPTTIGKKASSKKNRREKVKPQYARNTRAVDAFLKVLKKHNIDKNDKINKKELELALKDKDFPQCHRECLFGKDVTVEEAMIALDKNNDGEIQYNELVQFIERTGVCLQAHFLGYQRQEIKGIKSFALTLYSAMETNMKRNFVEDRDIERTVGINTGHVGTLDFDLKLKDREYVVEQGRRSTEAFLREYIAKNKPPLKSSSRPKTEINQTETSADSSNKTQNKVLIQDMTHGKSKQPITFQNKVAANVEPPPDINGGVANEIKTSIFQIKL